ncbi:MATE family efflux transporter [Pedobacter antarcticus]|uniref:Multidrug-efflux transporter n=2 Tax=Pedobacter antarcticus TaxID=34086 RepID=A0A081PLV3_9SPHI|nr:MATE family efflux transporter [Pedobacter antarcticus]KEQ31676.1 multidrug transporter [Pedobacter antarcticus 4BY]SDL49835.1 multidrug resistance protein, MATE family [Pedobacter antarcticus]SFE35538.1 multidrug resistance protein, MATE family [Pedobacter antarcticus]
MFSAFYSKYKPYYKDNLRLALPIVVSQLGHTLVHLADSVIVGHFAGTIQLAAVSLVNSLFMLILVLGMGIAYGLTPLIAQENGRKNHGECGRLLSNSLIINIAASIVLYLFVHFGTLLAIDHIGQSPEVVAYAKPYLGYLAVSIIPLMIFQTFKQFTEGLGFTKQAMFISIWGNLINIILGVIFVKGMFGIAPMGVKGVGLSTLIDRILMALVMTIYVFRSANFKVYLRSFKISFIDKVRCLKIFKIGAPVALQYSFEISAFSGAAILIGTIGAIEQAAHQVAINLASVTYMLASGIASAATIKTGNNFGKNNFLDLRLSAIASYHVIIAFMSLTALVFIFGNTLLPNIYTNDNAVIQIAAQLLIIAGFFQLFDGTQVVGLGVLRGIGDVNVPTLITFVAYWVIGIPLGYLLGIRLGMGVNGIWYGLTIGLLAASFMLFFRFQNKTRLLVSQS